MDGLGGPSGWLSYRCTFDRWGEEGGASFQARGRHTFMIEGTLNDGRIFVSGWGRTGKGGGTEGRKYCRRSIVGGAEEKEDEVGFIARR